MELMMTCEYNSCLLNPSLQPISADGNKVITALRVERILQLGRICETHKTSKSYGGTRQCALLMT